MGRIQEAVVALAEREDWPFTLDGAVVSIPVAGQNGRWTAHALERVEQEQLLVHSVFPELVAPPRRHAVMIFITRANFGLVIGSFELDLDDGELRFRTSLDVEGAALEGALVEHLVSANVSTMDRYLPGLRAVLGGADPVAAIDAVHHPGTAAP